MPAMTTTTPRYMSSCRRLLTAVMSSWGRPCCIVWSQPVAQKARGWAMAMSTPAMMQPARIFWARACSSGPSALTRLRIKGRSRAVRQIVKRVNKRVRGVSVGVIFCGSPLFWCFV